MSDEGMLFIIRAIGLLWVGSTALSVLVVIGSAVYGARQHRAGTLTRTKALVILLGSLPAIFLIGAYFLLMNIGGY